MTNPTDLIEKFIANNNLSNIKATIFTMAIRDCKTNAELWKNSNIEEEVTELFMLLEKISQLKVDN